LIAIFSSRYAPKLFNAPSVELMTAAFGGPAVAGLLILAWWLFASRASIKEKAIGFGSVLLVATLSIKAIHPSLKGTGTILHVVPNGIAGFGIPLLLLAGAAKYRLTAALICAVLTFVYWDFVQLKGLTGSYVPELTWRWNRSAEQSYLANIADALPASKSDFSESDGPITLASAEWPSFRGPNRDGKQPGIAFESNWQKAPPLRLWQTKMGPGWSSFTVAGDRLFTQEQRGDNEAVLCLNANTGEVIWAYEYASRFWESIAGTGPRATPTIADEGLFAMGGDGILMCLDPLNGKLIWQTDLKKDADRKAPEWGFASSPLITEQVVIVHAGGKGDNGVIAYDVRSGARNWSVSSGDHSYSSPQLATLDRVTGVLMTTNTGLQFLAAKTGKQLWQHDWPFKSYRILQPNVVGNRIVVASSIGQGTRCIEATQNADQWHIDVKWTTRDLKPDFNDFVEHKGFLYGFDSNIFECVDLATGKRKWKGGRYGNGQVLLLPDEDQLLISTESGELVLVLANDRAFVELARFAAIEGKTWNHPVVIGSRVYIRNAEQAACFELKTRLTTAIN